MLVEKTSKKDANQVAGKTENMRWVNFDADPAVIGHFVDVVVTEALPNSLRGRLVPGSAEMTHRTGTVGRQRASGT